MEDAEMILQWRNDALTRKHSFSKQIISAEEHNKWFQQKLSDANCDIYILIAGNERIGQIRIENADGIGKINYTIAPEWRGRGCGKSIIALAEEMLKNEGRDYQALVGMVASENEASKQCFRTNGYTELLEGDTFCFIKTLKN